MKSVKVIFISMELACLFGVLALSFSESAEVNLGHWFRASYISLFAALAVVMQREQQSIDWDVDE